MRSCSQPSLRINFFHNIYRYLLTIKKCKTNVELILHVCVCLCVSLCALAVSPSSPPRQPKRGQDLERCPVHLLIVRKLTGHYRR